MKITVPTKCPSCGSSLVLVKDQLFCRNRACEAQSAKKIEHFCKTLKMKGFGPVALSKLNFESILDLFNFSESYYKETLGDTIGVKLFAEVRKAEKQATLNKVLAGLSINLIGETASNKLCEHISNIEDINKSMCNIAGLGEKATNSLLDYLESEEYQSLKSLLLSFKMSGVIKEVPSNGLKVCITGKLVDFKNRSDAAKHLESLGYIVVDSITKATNILINEEDRDSSKLTKAKSLGIRITTIKNLEKEMI